MSTTPSLVLHPNPAVTWSAINVDMKSEPQNAFVVVHDLAGQEVTKLPIVFKAGQLVLDTRGFPAGSYTVDLVNGGTRLATEKLVVQP